MNFIITVDKKTRLVEFGEQTNCGRAFGCCCYFCNPFRQIAHTFSLGQNSRDVKYFIIWPTFGLFYLFPLGFVDICFLRYSREEEKIKCRAGYLNA